MPARELTAAECHKRIEPAELHFQTTEEVEPVSGIAAQERALAALSFGLDIRHSRFHVVVVGPPGSGRTFCARQVARRLAATLPTPDDMLLLPNPRRPSEPTVLTLPAGEGRPFTEAMEELYAKLLEAIHGATEGERWKQARARGQRRVEAEESRLEEELRAQAKGLGLEVVRAGREFQVTPLVDESPPSEAIRQITAAIEAFEERLAEVQDEADSELRATTKQLLHDAVKACFAPVRARFEGREELLSFLGEVETLVARETRLLVDEPDNESPALVRGIVVPTLLTEHKPGSGAPVVEVPYPTLSALFGRSYAPPDTGTPPEPGFAVAGALHLANGGFLILPANALLKNEALYEQLKACLLASKFIVPEHNPTYYRGTSEELMFPPMTLDLKVVLIASPDLYQDLHEADPEFSQLFKVQARFEGTMPLAAALATYPSFLADIVRERKLLPLTADAVAELFFYGGRLAESQRKVTAQLGLLAEVATEASYRAARKGKPVVDGGEICGALGAARRRGEHFRDHVHELLADGTIRIDVTGRRVGQVNAVSVLSDGPVTFGRPCRVTAVVYPGTEGPVNIAREVEMSGPIHAKGVLVLSGFLSLRFAQLRPLSFGASLVFEQTYEAIDGDSASSSELYALVSALSGYALRQDLAVTGSVDQQGGVLPVGGLNEKIEAFYDLCAAKGLTGHQGVLIPATNQHALMLRSDVVEAIERKQFHVHVVSAVEEGIELLTGSPAGIADDTGHYPAGTVFGAIEHRLERFWRAMAETGRAR
ncbi:ATP-binding protein [Polyangium spumosum]|uniref:endopeptidase La n=1 Tax=Polyangium spumosum TaxID=889282 RepID=A0A6N7PQU5_9BACT|nr:ATP-binding protein [Polyangium spumosum]MRG94428.1 AAA family ATPase [Polyangium spumosum]